MLIDFLPEKLVINNIWDFMKVFSVLGISSLIWAGFTYLLENLC